MRWGGEGARQQQIRLNSFDWDRGIRDGSCLVVCVLSRLCYSFVCNSQERISKEMGLVQTGAEWLGKSYVAVSLQGRFLKAECLDHKVCGFKILIALTKLLVTEVCQFILPAALNENACSLIPKPTSKHFDLCESARRKVVSHSLV